MSVAYDLAARQQVTGSLKMNVKATTTMYFAGQQLKYADMNV